MLIRLVSLSSNDSIFAKIDFVKYGVKLTRGDEDADTSGAYLFNPDKRATQLDYYDLVESFRIEYGSLRIRSCVKMLNHVALHCAEFYPTISKALNLKHPFFGVWNLVDLRSSHNTEIAMKILTTVASNNSFYTDLNGFQV